MAVVVDIGRWWSNPLPEQKNCWERLLESPFYKAEMNRVEMSRAEHPGRVNECVIDLLYIWAAVYTGISAYWFVKYVICSM